MFVVMAIVSSTFAWSSPASATVASCTASGKAFPELLTFEFVTDPVSAEGWRVETLVSGRFADSPSTIIVNFIHGPVRHADVLHLRLELEGSHDAALVYGSVPPDLPTGEYRLYNVVLTDVSDCSSVYYQIDNTVEFTEPTGGAISQSHSIDLSNYTLELVDGATIPPDPYTWTQAQKYMNALTETFLGRPASRDEIINADHTIASNGRLATAQSLASSQEWAGQVVNGIYQAALDRQADASGRAYWVDRLLHDGHTRDTAIAIYGSPEAFDRAGGSAPTFIDALYNRILARNPDPAGKAFWGNLLDSGKAEPWQVVASFWESIEFRSQRVERVYQQVLQRPADPDGLQYWAERLLVDDDVVLAALLASSDEFYFASR